jgi:hypothetical protein
MVLNQDLQDFEDFYQRGVGWDGACRSLHHFFILYSFNLWGNRGLSCIMVLNQDSQDFEDFYQRGVG